MNVWAIEKHDPVAGNGWMKDGHEVDLAGVGGRFSFGPDSDGVEVRGQSAVAFALGVKLSKFWKVEMSSPSAVSRATSSMAWLTASMASWLKRWVTSAVGRTTASESLAERHFADEGMD